MVQIIAGKKGKGKTKHLLDMANGAIKEANGSIVYLAEFLSMQSGLIIRSMSRRCFSWTRSAWLT